MNRESNSCCCNSILPTASLVSILTPAWVWIFHCVHLEPFSTGQTRSCSLGVDSITQGLSLLIPDRIHPSGLLYLQNLTSTAVNSQALCRSEPCLLRWLSDIPERMTQRARMRRAINKWKDIGLGECQSGWERMDRVSLMKIWERTNL